MPKHILALETTARVGGVALLAESEVLREIPLDDGLRHGVALMPAAQELLREAGIAPTELAAVAVDVGPGSYTGTRIGVMSAKTLAFGAGVPLIGVGSLQALALDAIDLAAHVVPVLTARKGEAYAGVYTAAEAGAARPRNEVPDRALTPEACAALAEGAGYVVVGDAVRDDTEFFLAHCADGTELCLDFAAPGAGAVGRIAHEKLLAGQLDDPRTLQPTYLRREDSPAPFA